MANVLDPNPLFSGGLVLPPTTTPAKKTATAVPNGQFAGSNLYAVANVGTKRNLLQKAGYSVDPHGPETTRLNAAWDNYFHTKGLGAAAWNITPAQFDPTQGGTSNAAKAAKAKAGGGRVPAGTPGVDVPGATTASIPGSPGFADLYANVKTPKNPITDLSQFAKQYAIDQSNTQFNPIIAALQQGIARQPGDTNAATQGIADLYKPVQDLASANVPTAADAANRGISTVQDVGSQIGQAFGLGPGSPGSPEQAGLGDAIGKSTVQAAGALAQQGAASTDAARAQQQIAQQGQVDSTNTWRNTEQQSINGLKDQLLQAISGRAAARASGVAAGMELGQKTEGNYLSQLDQISTGKEQAAFADQAFVKGDLANQGAAQDVAGKTYQNKVAPIVLRDQLLGNAVQRTNAAKQLALQSKQFDLKNSEAISRAAQQAGGWGAYLANPKNALGFAASMRELLVDKTTGAPIAGTTPSSAYNTIAHTMASAGFPANTPQGQQLLVQALQGAGFDLSGYQLDANGRGLVLIPKSKSGATGAHSLTSKESIKGFLNPAAKRLANQP